MSLCRWDWDCDVYVYYSTEDCWVVCVRATDKNPEIRDEEFDTSAAARDFLCVLRSEGYEVPDYVIETLSESADEEGV